MDPETQALLDSLTDEQLREIRKMMQAVVPVFKVFAQALISVLDDEQRALLSKITEDAQR